ncbi:phosphoserine phosphatase SerB [Nitrosococcus watsonii]|uniref:Phosphoserine phosphatase n=1 Tax=Nitrosococcus watsoni (strain C-113) TaxID=105559 RepID=D8KB52_NITWC|nr:phosphoserine phosphatase SerB [Nitrosococcus watsonii]ADJ27586.1 phosphoserine phosphatase SerB [Nitrosococcus watsonii C-113]
MPTLILQGSQLTRDLANKIAQQTNAEIRSHESYYRLYSKQPFSPQTLAILHSTHNNLDINLFPEDYYPEQIRLFITDMDSTFINIECINEIAAFTGKEARVSAITTTAMQGEINFETSLIQRVKLLAGVSAHALAEIYEKNLTLNPGGKALLAALKQRDIKIALVSGGFTYFTERLKQEYNLDYTLANQLEVRNNQLTGALAGQIVGASAKAKFLLMLCEKLAIKPWQTIAIGDGANDLEMLKVAGLSIAYHAKPKVQAAARITLNHSGLDGVLPFLSMSTAILE